jgi:hypothetical protein
MRWANIATFGRLRSNYFGANAGIHWGSSLGTHGSEGLQFSAKESEYVPGQTVLVHASCGADRIGGGGNGERPNKRIRSADAEVTAA